MLKLLKMDLVTIAGKCYMVSTFEEPEGFSIKIHANGALPRIYYRECPTLDAALLHHGQILRDIKAGSYKFYRNELKWLH